MQPAVLLLRYLTTLTLLGALAASAMAADAVKPAAPEPAASAPQPEASAAQQGAADQDIAAKRAGDTSTAVTNAVSEGDIIPDAVYYYPIPPQNRVRITEEDYQDKYKALAGLPGAYFDLSNVESFTKKWDSPLPFVLYNEIKKRLDTVGFRMLTEEESLLTPGQPRVDIWPSFKPSCCSIGFWASMTEGSKLMRAPEHNYRFGTWGGGSNFLQGEDGNECPHKGEWLADELMKKFDGLVADLEKAKAFAAEVAQTETPAAEPEAAPSEPVVEAAPPETEPAIPECNTALRLYVQIFPSNRHRLDARARGIFDELARAMLECKTYVYLIETHSDTRGTAAHNLKLSQRRSKAIADYLVSKGIPTNRFKLRYYGETRPVSFGRSALDHSSNRRVVVTPFKRDKK